MPFYDYRCTEGHVTEHRFSMAEKPAEVACPMCEAPAKQMMSAPVGFCNGKTTVTPKDPPRNESVKVLRYQEWECLDCKAITLMFLNDEGVRDEDPCEKCGGWRLRHHPKEGYRSEIQYPYFDEMLGCEITSPDHRRRVKREHGVEEISDHDLDNMDRFRAPLKAHRAQVQKETEEYEERLERDPVFAKFRQWRDRGGLDAMIADAMRDEPTHFTVNSRPHAGR